MLRFHQPKFCLSVCVLFCALISSAFAGVAVNSPSQGVTVQSPVHFVATANSTCSKGISAIGVYTAPNVLAYVGKGASINTNLSLGSGSYKPVVVAWDNCGGAATANLAINVQGQSGGGGGGTGGGTFTNLHSKGGWTGYAL